MDFTSRLGLNKPDGDPVTGDVVDIEKLNENFDALDAVVSYTPCTSTARPGAPFVGQAILETDTGKSFVWGGSGWLPNLIGLTPQLTNIGLGVAADASPARRIKAFWAGTTGGTSMVQLSQSGAAAASRAFGLLAGGEAFERFTIDFDGKVQWGQGTGFDVSLYRGGSNTLQTDDWFRSHRGAVTDWAFGADITGDTNPRFLIKNDGGMEWGPGTSTGDVTLSRSSTNRLRTNGPFEILGPPSSSSEVLTFNHGYRIFVDNAGAGGNATRFWLDTPDLGEIVLGPRSGSAALGQIRIRTNDTTSLGANTVLDGDVLKKSTSSLRYKVNVRDEQFDHSALLRLRPVRFQDKRQYEKQGEEAREYVGLIAEEVDALGLKEFVFYDGEGRPDGVQYDRLVVGLLSLVKDLYERREA